MIDYIDVEIHHVKRKGSNAYERPYKPPRASARGSSDSRSMRDVLIDLMFDRLLSHMKPYVDANGMISEFYVRDSIIHMHPSIDHSTIDSFLSSVPGPLAPSSYNGYMYHYDYHTIQTLLFKDSQQIDVHHIDEDIKNIYKRNNIRPLHHDNANNGRYVYDGNLFTSSVESECSVKESMKKMKDILTDIRTNILSANPNAREKNLPLSTPILKLCMVEDTDDDGIVDEDVLINILAAAFFKLNIVDINRIVCLGRSGTYADRRVDYMKMMRHLEEYLMKV